MPLGAARFSFSGGTKPFDPNLGSCHTIFWCYDRIY